VMLSSGFFNTLRATFLREAQDRMAMYHDDARINGLQYDRHEEARAVDVFTEALLMSGTDIGVNPLGPSLIPNWNRVFSAVPNFVVKLLEAVEKDNERCFS